MNDNLVVLTYNLIFGMVIVPLCTYHFELFVSYHPFICELYINDFIFIVKIFSQNINSIATNYMDVKVIIVDDKSD